ncbi:hypothetical protein WN71_026345 [Streptomyces mangrovisoli]|uniref:Uncharacterized protein n=1 Tax=Streptomyces mangrovisoli TaxID=1428628 RepID=A0A1J4NRC0_9ACTN|nr:hypothetical protein WN71_026345 [Streptomyces mangrovisoli]
MRDLLAEGAHDIRPSPVPYHTIRRRGMIERRQRIVVAGAAFAALAAVPVGAYALGGHTTSSPAAPTPSVLVTRPATTTPASTATTPVPDPSGSAPATSSAPPTPSGTTAAAGPAAPATGDQLLDGITFAQASDGLSACLSSEFASMSGVSGGLGTAHDYRIILAMPATGDTNAPGDGIYVVAVTADSHAASRTRLICTVKGGKAEGLNTSGSGQDGSAAVVPDMNAGKLYQESALDKGAWKLPFRWGDIGTVRPSVAKVTVSYGNSHSVAVLDHGWFVATGSLDRKVTLTPHIKGYDAHGKLVYDSDQDPQYEKTLP